MNYIVNATDLRVGADLLISGDKIEIDDLVKRGAFSERLVEQLLKQRSVAKLSREAFQTAIARRPQGAPWPPVGFTEAYLLECELIDPPSSVEPPPPPPVKPEVVRITSIELTQEKVAVGPYFYQPRKVGNFTFFDVADANGNLLRDRPFRKAEQAAAFLEEIYTNPDGAANTAQDSGEHTDDGDLRSGAHDGQGPDPTANR